MSDIRKLQQQAADKVRWDKATLHQKMGEIVELIEAMRRRLEGEEGVSSGEIRVLLNEVTRRSSVLEICRVRFPEEKQRIHITLNIADDWISKLSLLLKSRRTRPSSSVRSTIEQGFQFLSKETRKAMLKAHDDGQEDVILKKGAPITNSGTKT